MKTELKGWLADNTVTTDNKEDKIQLFRALHKFCNVVEV